MKEDHEDLSTAVGRLIQDATNTDNDIKREELMDRWMGEPYGDEVDGRSKFVSTDCADAVGAIHADIMDAFTSAENVVEFAPVGPEDEDAAKQETAAVSHIFWQENNGFIVLDSALKECEVAQNSYVKYGWETQRRVDFEEYDDLMPEELAQVLQQIQEQAAEGAQYSFLKSEGFEIDEAGNITQTGRISVKLRCVKEEKKYRVRVVPQEEFFHTPRWPNLSLKGIPCCGHKREMEVGELRAMGFSQESLDEAGLHEDEEIADQRHTTKDVYESDEDDGKGALRKVTVYETYVRADRDEDGIAEQLLVWAANDGSTILKWENGEEAVEEVGHIPFASFTPEIVPHRHIGRSVVEKVREIQHVNTVLIRQTLDNIYLTNYPRPEYDPDQAGELAEEDLANPAPGAPIRTRVPINWNQPQPVYSAIIPLMEKFDDLKQQRTGATRYNQGLESESLNKTATGAQIIHDAGQKRTLLIARTIAETGLMELFRGIHRDLRNGPLRKLVMKLRGTFVEVNPRTWRDRTDMTVNVGMGSGNRDTIRQGLMLIGQAQEKMMAAGMPMVGMQQVYNTAEKMAETYGMQSVEPFFVDPAKIPPPPQQEGPDPQEQLMQAQIQAMQADAQAKQMKAQTEQMKAQMQAKQQEIEFAAEERRAQQEFQAKMADLQAKRQATIAGIQTQAGRLELDRDKAILEDDRIRDVEELKAATGYMRDVAKTANTTPPMSYGSVGQ